MHADFDLGRSCNDRRVARDLVTVRPSYSNPVLNSIFTIFTFRPSSSVIQLPMSAARSAFPVGEIQLTTSGSRSSSSTPTTV